MTTSGFTLFDTAVGTCAIAWNECGVVGVRLPDPTASAIRARMRRRFPGASETEPPAAVQTTIDGIVALLSGEPRDLSDVMLDMDGVPAFDRSVYEVARTIPPGATLTYGEIAARLGAGREVARDVGQALGKNPFPIVVPCHRVLAANGKLGGFSAPGGTHTKTRLLRIEGALPEAEPTLFDLAPPR